MRRKLTRPSATRGVAVAFTTMSILVAGCSSGSSSTTSTSTTSTSVVPPSSLLMLADVGSQWKVGPEVTDADFADATQVPCKGITLDPAVVARLRPTTGVQFEPAEHAYRFLSELVTTGSPTQLADDIDTYLAVEKSCADSPNNGLLAFKKMTIPELGDQSSAWVLSAYENGASGAVWHIRSAIVRVGGTMANINLTEILETPDQKLAISDAEFQRIVTAAVDHLPAA